MSAWSALLSSFAEVQQVLREQSIERDVKVLRRLAYRYAQRARNEQQRCAIALEGDDTLRAGVSSSAAMEDVFACGRTSGGPKTKKGRSRDQGAWHEPKLLVIDVVNADGRQEKKFAPIIDGCLQGPDAVFERIKCYLQALNIGQADQVLFVADGAHWIWNRVSDLLKDEAVQSICRGRHGKSIAIERDYFVRNQERMNYAAIKALKLPIGSGAVESGVRRVINLRLKGACIFWHRENAEKILMLRAYFKAGRWDILKRMANSSQISTTV